MFNSEILPPAICFARMANIVKSTSVTRKQGANCTKQRLQCGVQQVVEVAGKVMGTTKAGGWVFDCLAQAHHWNNERKRHLEHSSSVIIRICRRVDRLFDEREKLSLFC
jgi:hypothetical protein